MTANNLQLIQGCLLGGAVGDALGAPVEFMSLASIRAKYGLVGISNYSPVYGRIGAITDDTQMTLFTAEGLLRAYVRANLRGICSIPSVVCGAYLRWLETQKRSYKRRKKGTGGWLYHVPELWSQRAPGNTCLSSLEAMKSVKTDSRAPNDSKGAGGIMRVGPAAMMYAGQGNKALDVFCLAMECAWLTHGHPSGFLSAAAYAVVLHAVLCGKSIKEGIDTSKSLLIEHPDHAEVIHAINAAVRLADDEISDDEAIQELGEAWVGEEALGIALFCSLRAKNLETGVMLAVNHDGDSDTTGILVGQLLGAKYGLSAIPERWLENLELRDVLMTIATDLSEHESWNLDEYDYDENIVARYPGG